MVPAEQEWVRRWEDMRRRGRTHFVLRGFILEGLSVGLVVAVFAAFAQRIYSKGDSQSWSWAFLAFVFVSLWGLIRAWSQWHVSEQRYRDLHPSNGS